MSYVKLDSGILSSSLWVERNQRDIFITALLMALPYHVKVPMPGIKVRSLEPSGFVVPPGDYGFVSAAGPGICRMALVTDEEGLIALEKLSQPDLDSRTPDHDGRRLVRVSGGYIVLNYMIYREKDYTGAERAKRYRERMKDRHATECDVTRDGGDETANVTQAEAEAVRTKPSRAISHEESFKTFWQAYPLKKNKGDAEKAFKALRPNEMLLAEILAGIVRAKDSDQWAKDGGRFTPHPATWLRAKGWEDEGLEKPPPVNGSNWQADWGYRVV